MEKFDAMNKDMFDEYVDGNGDGSATIEEIEMVSTGLKKFAIKISIFFSKIEF